jgi:hypothetical protein
MDSRDGYPTSMNFLRIRTMQNPFPGMNPYLEQPGLWPQVHNRLIVAIADELTPQIAPKYHVSIEERIYTTTESFPLLGIADVAVTSRSSASSLAEASKLTAPRRVRIPLPVSVKERFLEVRLVQTNAVICVVEILSPTNKRSGEGRTTYAAKRQKILNSATHLVEIDLLRSGQPMPIEGTVQNPYSILVSRSHERPDAELYDFALPETIPDFPVPLRSEDPEPVVHLQNLLNQIYTRARFDLVIDYRQNLQPVPSEAEIAWIATVVNLPQN